MRLDRVLAAAVTLAAVLASPARTAAEAPPGPRGVRIYEGETEWSYPSSVSPTPEQLFAHTPYDHDWQTHSFYWLGILDNGWVVLVSPFQWTWGALGTWGLNIIAYDGAGRVFSYDGKLGDGSPQAAPEGLDVHAGSSFFRPEGSGYHWHIEVPGFAGDLSFASRLPPWIPGDGVAEFTTDGRFYTRYALPAPWADLSGYITAFGTTVNARGQCLLDSSETLLPLSRTNSEIRAFRLFSPPGTPRDDQWMLAQLTTISHPAYGSLHLPMLLLAHGSSWVLTTKDFSLEPLEWGVIDDPPYPFPSRYRLTAERMGVTLSGTVTADRPYYVTDVFARLPKLFRAVAALFLKRPVIYRMLARFDGTVALPDGTRLPVALDGQAEYLIAK